MRRRHFIGILVVLFRAGGWRCCVCTATNDGGVTVCEDCSHPKCPSCT